MLGRPRMRRDLSVLSAHGRDCGRIEQRAPNTPGLGRAVRKNGTCARHLRPFLRPAMRAVVMRAVVTLGSIAPLDRRSPLHAWSLVAYLKTRAALNWRGAVRTLHAAVSTVSLKYL